MTVMCVGHMQAGRDVAAGDLAAEAARLRLVVSRLKECTPRALHAVFETYEEDMARVVGVVLTCL